MEKGKSDEQNQRTSPERLYVYLRDDPGGFSFGRTPHGHAHADNEGEDEAQCERPHRIGDARDDCLCPEQFFFERSPESAVELSFGHGRISGDRSRGVTPRIKRTEQPPEHCDEDSEARDARGKNPAAAARPKVFGEADLARARFGKAKK